MVLVSMWCIDSQWLPLLAGGICGCYTALFSETLWKFSFVVTVLKFISNLEFMYVQKDTHTHTHTKFESAYIVATNAINFRKYITKRGSLALAMHPRDKCGTYI